MFRYTQEDPGPARSSRSSRRSSLLMPFYFLVTTALKTGQQVLTTSTPVVPDEPDVRELLDPALAVQRCLGEHRQGPAEQPDHHGGHDRRPGRASAPRPPTCSPAARAAGAAAPTTCSSSRSCCPPSSASSRSTSRPATLGLVGTPWGMIVIYTGVLMPLSVFLYAGFFRRLPRDYEEAATVDGASRTAGVHAHRLPADGAGHRHGGDPRRPHRVERLLHRADLPQRLGLPDAAGGHVQLRRLAGLPVEPHLRRRHHLDGARSWPSTSSRRRSSSRATPAASRADDGLRRFPAAFPRERRRPPWPTSSPPTSNCSSPRPAPAPATGSVPQPRRDSTPSRCGSRPTRTSTRSARRWRTPACS